MAGEGGGTRMAGEGERGGARAPVRARLAGSLRARDSAAGTRVEAAEGHGQWRGRRQAEEKGGGLAALRRRLNFASRSVCVGKMGSALRLPLEDGF